MHLKVITHQDGAEYWSEIGELPGCFASGRTLTELREALAEAVGLYLWGAPADVVGTLSVGASAIEVRPVAPPSR